MVLLLEVLAVLLLVVLGVLAVLLLVVLVVSKVQEGQVVLVALAVPTLVVNPLQVDPREVHHPIIHFNNLYTSKHIVLLVDTCLINTTSIWNPIVSYLS